jgi:2-phospho-L-lactate guanylyltransferase
MYYVLIPIRDLDGAKTRLAGVLDAASRRDLVVAMYRDVLAAATACAAIDRVAVVSGDSEALGIAEAAGAETIREDSGLNEALASASRTLAARGVDRVLILFADLPLANAAAIERVVLADADVALVRAGDGGTNALALAPGAIEFQYGQDSAAKHIDAAERAGLRVALLDEPSLALDMDTPEDLERLRQSSGVGAQTLAVLTRMGRTGDSHVSLAC